MCIAENEKSIDEMSKEELSVALKEQKNYIEVLKNALREVLDQNDEVKSLRVKLCIIVTALMR